MDIPTNWTFETSGVAQGFDRHVREQLPWYDLATNAILHVARHYIPENGLVYDFGASTGNIGRALAPILKKKKCTSNWHRTKSRNDKTVQSTGRNNMQQSRNIYC